MSYKDFQKGKKMSICSYKKSSVLHDKYKLLQNLKFWLFEQFPIYITIILQLCTTRPIFLLLYFWV